jgi:hypothetical protein
VLMAWELTPIERGAQLSKSFACLHFMTPIAGLLPTPHRLASRAAQKIDKLQVGKMLLVVCDHEAVVSFGDGRNDQKSSVTYVAG